MLAQLEIRNFAVIEDLGLEFADGLNILTGETGAGKSIIINALALICGGKGQREFVRTGCETLEVCALFADLPPAVEHLLEEQELRTEDGTLVLRRLVQFDSGRSRAWVNGRLQPLGFLRQLGEHLIDIHAQNQHQGLLNPQYHLDLLDGFLQDPAIRDTYTAAWKRWQQADRELRLAREQSREQAQRLDLICMQIQELEQAALQPGEDDELEIQLRRLSHARDISDACQQIAEQISGADSAVQDRIMAIARQLDHLTRFEPDFCAYAEEIQQVLTSLQEISQAASTRLEEIAAEDGQLEDVESRLREIDRLKLKYAPSANQMLEMLEDLRAERAELEVQRDHERLEREVSKLRELRDDRAAALGKARKTAADLIQDSARRQLSDLGMPKARFEVRLQATDCGPRGTEDAEFLLSANPGESLRSLSRVASGGEMSRIMLALKSVLVSRGTTSTFVFDEVDTGVSGAVAEMVGEKLRELATHSQVITITHLPQVAVKAQRHFRIAKDSDADQTRTHVHQLDRRQRVAEIARLLGGIELTQAELEHAQTYLERMS